MNDERQEQYLPEDKDILDEIEAIGPPSTGTPATGQLNKLISLQIKAALRNRKTAHNLDKSTRKYSLVLIAFALVQVVIGIYQFVFDVEYSSHAWVGLLYVAAILMLGYFIFRELTKLIEQ